MSRAIDLRPPGKQKSFTDGTIKHSRRGKGKRFLPLLSDEDRALVESRPRTRGECEDGPRPCPFVGCRYNAWLDVSRGGAVKFNHPDIAPEDMPAAWSCTLDVADRGPHTLVTVGRFMNLVRERIRQIEFRALKKLGVLAKELRKEI